MSDQTPIDQLCHGAVDVISRAELERRLASGKPLRVKFGADPSAPDLHLGHFVVLKKLRDFQQAGHTVIFLIGDFTGMIGDPTGRSETRRALTREEVAANAVTYQEQIFRVLDRDKTEVRFNSEWMDKVAAGEMIRLLSHSTVARMLERDDFAKRYKEQAAIGIHEFVYPIIQGYDSVALKADVEIGGTDQRFNLLMGRDLQRDHQQPAQIVFTMPLLEGIDGHAKMSKSLGNAIGITEPPGQMFGKVMSISDELMIRYYDLLTAERGDTIRRLIAAEELHPMDAKKRLGSLIVAEFHGTLAAAAACGEFEKRFQRRQLPSEISEIEVSAVAPQVALPRLLVDGGLVRSMSEARRMISQGAVRVDGTRVQALDALIDISERHVLIEVGSKKIVKIRAQPRAQGVSES